MVEQVAAPTRAVSCYVVTQILQFEGLHGGLHQCNNVTKSCIWSHAPVLVLVQVYSGSGSCSEVQGPAVRYRVLQ